MVYFLAMRQHSNEDIKQFLLAFPDGLLEKRGKDFVTGILDPQKEINRISKQVEAKLSEPNTWSAVKALANELIEHRSLLGRECTQIIQKFFPEEDRCSTTSGKEFSGILAECRGRKNHER